MILAVAIVAFGLIGLWVIVTLNRFARLRNLVSEAWSNVDVALKRRHDLIPNLVDTVRGYANFERDLLENIVKLRNTLESRSLGIDEVSSGEAELTGMIDAVLARVEAYPDLKASEHFQALQAELAATEDRIAAARRFYNGNVRIYRTMLQSFPSLLLAGGATVPEFFELAPAERLLPR